jgi:hypothetical protein
MFLWRYQTIGFLGLEIGALGSAFSSRQRWMKETLRL